MSGIWQDLSPLARNAPESGIVEIMNAGRAHEKLIPLWAGEGHLPTPEFICAAAKDGLDRGETFYTYQRGIPELRTAIAGYHERLYGRPFDPERFFVTGSGMQAIQIAVQCVASAGDEILVPTPAWPNIAAATEIHGARAVDVPLTFHETGWELDIDRLAAAVTSRTRAIFLNTPCNPTGWVASENDLKAVLALARERGLWIVADEIYTLFYYRTGAHAPSFYDLIGDDDRVLFVNTFSKNWAMTGWRIGWISAPPVIGQVLENLIQYSTSGVPAFLQRGAVAALNEGDGFLKQQVDRARRGRELVLGGLETCDRIKFAPPDGAFYFFFAVDGVTDTRQFALDLVRATGVGLAPGSAFGDAGHGYLRLCYARSEVDLGEAIGRITEWMTGI